ncbi:hypothetical protein AIOL_004143 [Candidatus Rhodobacter oscarellae]|uniref:Uncharacterized protein n=1 Tax=Candidatus Rhodobacter oscarellae TaxID=1675527 RepID=A0A0J9E8R2_9RHOB|nr:DUF6502 family protein [Candidatus Rhodobacter lobularis]KMW59162.1 hypothetical protein AIOL_004143 [Candidatus Rhodobacter lobularis]
MLDVLDPIFSALARLMVARGVLFPDLAERMKGHYVRAATAQADGKVTDSRLSVMTGLQRRDVARLRDAPTREPRMNHLSRLVALWQTEDGYHVGGEAQPLPKNGPAPSFEALAFEVRKDVHPRTMLDALQAAGTARVDAASGEVELLEKSYQPLSGSDDQLSYLAKNMADHMSSASENVQGQTPPHFERAVHYTGLTEAQVTELRAVHAEAQMAVFLDLSQRATAMKAQNDANAAHRFRAGGYFYDREETD